MRIGLLTGNSVHPLLAAATGIWRADGHCVEQLHPDAVLPADPADVYLLKARTPAAIALARALEERGVPVLNSAAATEFCQDRIRMAHLAEAAGLPFPNTTAPGALRELTAIDRPLVVKSRRSRRDDLVARIDDLAQLHALAAAWPEEPVVLQDFVPGDGWDHKLWVVAGRVFAARRRSELAAGPKVPDVPVDGPHPWSDLALRVGEVFDLEVYGVDLLEVDGTPLIVDINAFPGIRGSVDAARVLAELAIRVSLTPDDHDRALHRQQ
ncbi:ATP-grasp domain-containing protein [Nocardia inohanensis]|uniref:ATP-grasp domain-containing protein n=1 Tax=Nocardia inohanensis TaxID=209246 RepID=UPI0008368583|nr:hypothetical protein [Nocardia inohanensis]